jgi:2',3'-cyclic-nucleotide 2'-phosphodiesterase (5'-nucleotidase family)
MIRYVLLTVLTLITMLYPLTECVAVQNLHIIYTGALKGELEPCGCTPKTDFGGLARLAGFLHGEGEKMSSYVLIDAGNFTDSDTPQGRLKAEAMLHSFRVMKYDAVAVAYNESRFDNEYLRSIIDKYDVPSVSSLQSYDNSMRITRGAVTINVSTEPGWPRENMLNILLTGEPVSDALQQVIPEGRNSVY